MIPWSRVFPSDIQQIYTRISSRKHFLPIWFPIWTYAFAISVSKYFNDPTAVQVIGFTRTGIKPFTTIYNTLKLSQPLRSPEIYFCTSQYYFLVYIVQYIISIILSIDISGYTPIYDPRPTTLSWNLCWKRNIIGKRIWFVWRQIKERIGYFEWYRRHQW